VAVSIPIAEPVPAALAGRIVDRAPRVLVVGDVVLDAWLTGHANRVGRDGPVPVVELDGTVAAPGGAANAAANLAALGARVELVTAFGDDAQARELRGLLDRAGVRTDRSVVELGRATPVKHRVVAGGQPVARYDSGPGAEPRRGTLAAAAEALADAVTGGPGVDAVLVADYGLGLLTGAVRDRLGELRERIPLLVVDARAPGTWPYADRVAVRPDLVTPDAAEAADLLGEPAPTGDRVAWAVARRADLVAASGGADVVVTLDEDGAVRLPADDDEPVRRTVTRPAPEARCCGAGDTFTAAHTAALATGVPAAAALVLAQAAAEVVVEREGTAVCSSGALTARLAAADRGGLLDHRDLAAVVAEHRARGARIVFTNGCFDVLHRGHVAYLRQARALGDLLVVALNSDDSVARLKGPQRPVNPLEDRAGVVGAIDGVDLVTGFTEDDPRALIELLRPDIYTKGGDYTPQMLPETPVVERLGGEVRVLDYLSDHSTTAIVGRIRAGDPAGEAR
jgi:D-beta-D-heptose 7-phosphate kinase/D-beta-D-heptose 1-phosphate adenosyltransferase